MNQHDVAVLDFLLRFYETADRIAVTVNRNTASDPHDETSETSVIGLEVGCRQAAHYAKVFSREIMGNPKTVDIGLMIGRDDIGSFLRYVFLTFGGKSQEQECTCQSDIVGAVSGKSAFGWVFVLYGGFRIRFMCRVR